MRFIRTERPHIVKIASTIRITGIDFAFVVESIERLSIGFEKLITLLNKDNRKTCPNCIQNG